jgi:hypothetical protein
MRVAVLILLQQATSVEEHLTQLIADTAIVRNIVDGDLMQ